MQNNAAISSLIVTKKIDSYRLKRVSFVRPGGNDTAIVWDTIPRWQQKKVAALIQSDYPNIEQVMFVERNRDTGLFRGQMAGGEFCGNATRSLGYLLLDGREGTIRLETSGTDRLLTVVVKNGCALTEIPIRQNLANVNILPQGEAIIHLDGIAHVITQTEQKIARRLAAIETIEQRKLEVKKVLTEMHLIAQPCAGVMVVKQCSEARFQLDPYVYVRDTGTLYYETGCGSGSAAIGLLQAVKTGQSVNDLAVMQPSGLSLIVSVERTQYAFKRASVSGPH